MEILSGRDRRLRRSGLVLQGRGDGGHGRPCRPGASGGSVVPAHWSLEVMNALLVAQRRGRIGLAGMTAHLNTIESLGLGIDVEMDGRTRRDTLMLAQSERLTVYDAAYLELALRTGTPLATLDKELRKAARKRGVAVEP